MVEANMQMYLVIKCDKGLVLQVSAQVLGAPNLLPA